MARADSAITRPGLSQFDWVVYVLRLAASSWGRCEKIAGIIGRGLPSRVAATEFSHGRKPVEIVSFRHPAPEERKILATNLTGIS